MVTTKKSGGDTYVWQRRTNGQYMVRWFGWLIGVMIFMWAWNYISGATTWFYVKDAPRVTADIFSRATPPKWEYIYQLGGPIWDTINIATLGTIIALFLAIPVAFLAATNTTPQVPIHPVLARIMPSPMRKLLLTKTGENNYTMALFRPIALLVIVSTRSINSLIWALLLVAIIGPGVFAGIMAISIRSIGFCAKLLYESIEEINVIQVEAVTATGAGKLQTLVYGIVPQILPTLAGVAVFRWDINIRESTILGYVGAGGIGLWLQSSMNILAWSQVSLILLVILVAVVVGEWVSAKVRGAII